MQSENQNPIQSKNDQKQSDLKVDTNFKRVDSQSNMQNSDQKNAPILAKTPGISQSKRMLSSDEQDGNSHRSAENDPEGDKTVIIENETITTIVQEEGFSEQRKKSLKKQESQQYDQISIEKPQGVLNSQNQIQQSSNQNNSMTGLNTGVRAPDRMSGTRYDVSQQQMNEKINVKPAEQYPNVSKQVEPEKSNIISAVKDVSPQQQPNIQQSAQQTNEFSVNPIIVQPQPNQQQQIENNEQDKKEEMEDSEESEEDQDKNLNEFVETSPSGRFKRFDEELGRGAYKTVYRGVDHDTGREIAWSIICLGRLPKSERPRIKSEIKIIKELNHPNIITFISAWICKEKEQIHFITEIITGGSLRQYLKKMGKPKLKVIKRWCHEILQGLSYLHDQQVPIIHRDIKCDNIFINSNSGEIKIGDLGLSTTMKNSYTSSVLGTPEFMAPELYEEYYGIEVDIYAFGMALLEMLTREAPYRECQNPAQIYRKVINREYPKSLEQIKNDQVKDFIMRCLDERTKRPTTKQLLESPFMLDTTSEVNNHYVEIIEQPKGPRKKRTIKNNLPDIQEDPVNEDTEHKAQNSQKIPDEQVQQIQKNVQSNANEEAEEAKEEKQDTQPVLNTQFTQVQEPLRIKEPEQKSEDKKENMKQQQNNLQQIQTQQQELDVQNQVNQSTQATKIQKQHSDEISAMKQQQQLPDKNISKKQSPQILQEKIVPAEKPKNAQQNQKLILKQPLETQLVKCASQIDPDIKRDQKQDHNQNPQDEPLSEKQSKIQSDQKIKSNQAFQSPKYSNESESDQDEKLNQTIIYLNNLDNEKSYRLGHDESRLPQYYESQDDEPQEMIGQDSTNMLKQIKSVPVDNQKTQANLFCDPKQVSLGSENKIINEGTQKTNLKKSSTETSKNISSKVGHGDHLNQDQPQQKVQKAKQPKVVEANVLAQLQEDIAREEQEKRRKEKKKEEEQEKLKREKQLLKESISKKHKPSIQNNVGTGGTGNNVQQITPKEPQDVRQRQQLTKPVQKQSTHDTNKQVSNQQNNMASPDVQLQAKQQPPVKKLKREDLDKETSKIKKFKEDQDKDNNHLNMQQLAPVNRGGTNKKQQRNQHQEEVLTPNKNDDPNFKFSNSQNQPVIVQKQTQQTHHIQNLENLQTPAKAHKSQVQEKDEPLQKVQVSTKREKETSQNQPQKPREQVKEQNLHEQHSLRKQSEKHLTDQQQQQTNHHQQLQTQSNQTVSQQQMIQKQTQSNPKQVQKTSSGFQEQKITEMTNSSQRLSQTHPHQSSKNKQPEMTAMQSQKIQYKKQLTSDSMQSQPEITSLKNSEKSNESQQHPVKQSKTMDKHSIDPANNLEWNLVKQQSRIPQTNTDKQIQQQQVHQKIENEIPRNQIKKHSGQQPTQMVTNTQQTVLALAQQEQAPQSIPMDIQIENNVVKFQYMLKSDTPDQILNELIQQKKLESNYHQTFLAQVKDSLQLYENARQKYIQQQQQHHQHQQLQQQQQQKAKQAEELKHSQDNVPHSSQKQLQKPHQDHPPQQSVQSKQTQSKQSSQQAQMTSSQAAQKPNKPDYHTDEFIKRRDDFKKIYKDMNHGIRVFFQLMIKDNLNVDQVLDIMDYQEEGDRKYKKNFIESLQNVHTKFLNKQTTTANQQKKNVTQSNQNISNSQHTQQVNKQSHSTQQLANSHHQQSQNVSSAQQNQLQNSQTSHGHHRKQTGGKKEREQSYKIRQVPDIRHLKANKRFKLNKNQVDQSEKHLKMVEQLQSLINALNGSIKILQQIDQAQKKPQNEIQDILTNVLDNQIEISNEVKVDGIFGETTEEEVIKLQERLNIEKDGIVTDQIVVKLEELLSRMNFSIQMKIDKIKMNVKHQPQNNDTPQPQVNQAINSKVSSSYNNLIEAADKQQSSIDVKQSTKEESKDDQVNILQNNDVQQIKSSSFVSQNETSVAKNTSNHSVSHQVQQSVPASQHQYAQQSQQIKMKRQDSKSSNNSNEQQKSSILNQGNQSAVYPDQPKPLGAKVKQTHNNQNLKKKVEIIKEQIGLEEQGSSGGTNPLLNSINEAPQEEGYDGDQTFMTMNSKEQENTTQDDSIIVQQQSQDKQKTQ